MSYLNTPRIVFTGRFRAWGPTKNNLLAALDDPTLLEPAAWDFAPLGNSDFALEKCAVRSAWDADGRLLVLNSDDAVIDSSVSGIGKMADLDPQHRRLTELVGMNLSITLPDTGADTGTPGAGPSGMLKATQLRDYWSDPDWDTPDNPNFATAWQSVLSQVLWSGTFDKSKVLAELHDASPDGLSVRICPIFSGDGDASGMVFGKVFGVVGPHIKGEPAQFVAARRLMTQRPAGQHSFPVASTLVDEKRGKLVVDLSNLPLGAKQINESGRMTGLVAAILEDRSAGGGIENVIGPSRDLTVDDWLQNAGLVEWDLNRDQLQLLKSRRLRLAFQLVVGSKAADPSLFAMGLLGLRDVRSRLDADKKQVVTRFLVMEEHPSGKYVDIDGRSIRLNPGEGASFGVYARRLGQPLPDHVVDFDLHKQLAIAAVESIILDPSAPGYPDHPGQTINSEPRDVLFADAGPLRVTTDRDGYAELKIQVRPGEIDLPAARRTIDSQLYFLGDPDGWQAWGALGTNSDNITSFHRVGAGCALAVLVFNTHDSIEDPTWDDIEPWLTRYANLYPAMKNPKIGLDLSIKAQVDANAVEIARRLSLPKDDVAYMPITRDLSEFRRLTILAYLQSVMAGKA